MDETEPSLEALLVVEGQQLAEELPAADLEALLEELEDSK